MSKIGVVNSGDFAVIGKRIDNSVCCAPCASVDGRTRLYHHAPPCAVLPDCGHKNSSRVGCLMYCHPDALKLDGVADDLWVKSNFIHLLPRFREVLRIYGLVERDDFASI